MFWMSAEGVPAFITISREIRTFRSVNEGDQNSIIDRVGDVEDNLSEEVPDENIEMLLARFHVDGVTQTSKDDLVKAILEELSKPLGPLSIITEGKNRMTE